MNIQRKKMIKKYIFSICIIFLTSCSLSPGMHMQTESNWIDDESSVYIESLNRKIKIEDITLNNTIRKDKYDYRIGKGDQISITVWGLNDIFPISNINPDQNLRRVDSNGNIFFPYVGIVKAHGKSQDELRNDLSNALSQYFKDPQLDISIARFNSQKTYLLGEVLQPLKIDITDIPLSLSDALGQTKGINNNTANGAEVYVIRQATELSSARIFRADFSSPAGFIAAGNFYLSDNDIVYVNAKGTARWNRVVSQFFPFSTFLNSVDRLVTSD